MALSVSVFISFIPVVSLLWFDVEVELIFYQVQLLQLEELSGWKSSPVVFQSYSTWLIIYSNKFTFIR